MTDGLKSAKQVREFVRRRCLQEGRLAVKTEGAEWDWRIHRTRELAFIEVLNAFDTPHKTKLKMPPLP